MVTGIKFDDTSKQKTYYELELERIAREFGLPEYQYIRVRQSKAFMEKFYAEKIALDKIALAACMSQFHYIRLFQRVYGTTPRQYLKDVRINKAKELIRKGVPVMHACIEVGYDGLPSFSTAFKKGTGFSPKAYQDLYKSNRE